MNDPALSSSDSQSQDSQSSTDGLVPTELFTLAMKRWAAVKPESRYLELSKIVAESPPEFSMQIGESLIWVELEDRTIANEKIDMSIADSFPVEIREIAIRAVRHYLQVRQLEAGQLLVRRQRLNRGHDDGDDTKTRMQDKSQATSPHSPLASSGSLISFVSELDRFSIQAEHSAGGLGVVFRAQDRQLDRMVAVKRIQSKYENDVVYRDKFFREASVTGKLEHPSIVPVYAMGVDKEGRPFYAMRFIKGQELKERIRTFHQGVQEGKLEFDGMELRKILRRFIDVCNAIHYAHSRGVLHRDLKPSNVMLGRFGETLVVDWGLARPFDWERQSVEPSRRPVPVHSEMPLTASDSDSNSQTRLGSFVGSVLYSSPEQLRGDLETLGAPSDVYSLGVILFEILTGKAPIEEIQSERQLADDILLGLLPKPRAFNSAVPRPLDAICRKAMAGRVDQRYATADELRLEIEAFLDDELIQAYPESRFEKFRRFTRKNPSIASGILVGALTTVGVLSMATLWIQRHSVQLAEAKALAEKQKAVASLNEAKASRNAAQAFSNARTAFKTVIQVIAEMQKGTEDELDPLLIWQRIVPSIVEMSDNLAKSDDDELKILKWKQMRVLVRYVRTILRESEDSNWRQSSRITSWYATLAGLQSDSDRRQLQQIEAGNPPILLTPIDASLDVQEVTVSSSLRKALTPELGSVWSILATTDKSLQNSWTSIQQSGKDIPIEMFELGLEIGSTYRENPGVGNPRELLEELDRRITETENSRVSTNSRPSLAELEIKIGTTYQLGQIYFADQLIEQAEKCWDRIIEACINAPELLEETSVESTEIPWILSRTLAAKANLMESNGGDPIDVSGLLQRSNEAMPQHLLAEKVEFKELYRDNLRRMIGLLGSSDTNKATQLEMELEEFSKGDQKEIGETLPDANLTDRGLLLLARGDRLRFERGNRHISVYREALADLASKREASPESVEAKRNLSIAYERLGISLMQSNPDEARSFLELTSQIRSDLAMELGTSAAKLEVAIAIGHLARLEEHLGRETDAIEGLSQQIHLLTPIVAEISDRQSALRHLVLAYWRLAEIYRRQFRFHIASELLNLAIGQLSSMNDEQSKSIYLIRLKSKINGRYQETLAQTKAFDGLDQIQTMRPNLRSFAMAERIRKLGESKDYNAILESLRAFESFPDQQEQDQRTKIAGYALLASIESDSSREFVDADVSRSIDLVAIQKNAVQSLAKAAREAFLSGMIGFDDLENSKALAPLRSVPDWKLEFAIPEQSLDVIESVLEAGGYVDVVLTNSAKKRLHSLEDLKGLKDSSSRIQLVQLVNFDGNVRVENALLEELGKLPSLNELWLQSIPYMSDAQLTHLAALSSLRTLALAGNPDLNEQGLKVLGSLPNLRNLFAGSTGFSDRTASQVVNLQSLSLLDLNSTAITDQGLVEIAKIRSLGDLCLTNTWITDKGVKNLRELNLSILRLSETDITNKAVKELIGMESLRVLSLSGNKLSDEVVDYLCQMKGLQAIMLDDTPISAEALKRLSVLPDLRNLYVTGCPMTTEELSELKRSLPFCEIDFTSVRFSEFRNIGRRKKETP